MTIEETPKEEKSVDEKREIVRKFDVSEAAKTSKATMKQRMIARMSK